jgi:hypothetical protein
LTSERVAAAIVKVASEGIAPEYSVPRWAAAFQVFRMLTPGLYLRDGSCEPPVLRARLTPRSGDAASAAPRVPSEA